MPKKREPTPEYDSERETRALLEKIGSNVKTIAEQHGSIKAEISQLRNSMENRFDTVEAAVMENSRQIKDLKTGQEKLKTNVEGLKTGQEEIKQKLDTTLTDHEKRIKKVEEKVGA